MLDANILTALDGSMIDAIYDMTIAYTNTYADKQVNPLGGNIPVSVHVHCNRVPIGSFCQDLIKFAMTVDEQTADGGTFVPTGVTYSGLTRDIPSSNTSVHNS